MGVLLLAPVPLKAVPPVADPSDVEHGSSLPAENNFGIDDIEPCIYQFWNVAWDMDFVLGQSGMVLESSETEEWQVLVIDADAEEPVVAEGSFLETERLFLGALAIPQEELDEAGIISYDHYVVAGLITGSSGVECALYGLATEAVFPGENPDDEPIVTRSLTPLEMADDSESAAAMAYGGWETFGFAAAMVCDDEDTLESPEALLAEDEPTATQPAEDEPTDVLSEEDAEELDRNCRDAALLRHQARRTTILAGTVSAIGGCAAGSTICTVAYLACLAACGTAAITTETLLLGASQLEYEADLLDCDNAKIERKAQS